MNKKKIYLVLAAIALVVIAAVVVASVLNPALTIVQAIDHNDYASSSDDDWDVITKGNIKLESSNIQLDFDVATTHFTVLNKNTGVLMSSVSDINTEELTEDASAYNSELVVLYYDTLFTKNYLYSSKNSVDFGIAEVKTNGDAIRVYYTLRKTQHKNFAPEVVTEKVYTEILEPNITKYLSRQFKIWYKLYNCEDTDSETNAMKSKYPALKKQNLYILKSGSVSENGYKEITSIMTTGGYTQDQYFKDAEELGIEVSEAGMTVGFVVPVEYKVTEEGFTARVLTDKFQSDSDNFMLTEFSLLPNFGAQSANTDGYVFIPDGSGAIINVAEKPGKSLSKNIYGSNGAISNQLSTQLAQNAYLPVFGYNRGEDGYFAVITNAAEEAMANVDILGGTNRQTDAYASFNLFNYDVTDIQAAASVPVYNLYTESPIVVNPEVRYYLLDSTNNSYSSMAKIYRDYLIETKVLGSRLEKTENIPFYLDLTGYFMTDETIVGVPYVKNNVISTLKGANEAVKTLSDIGVKDINVRLKAYGNGGLFQYLAEEFNLLKDVGSVEELKDLATLLKNQDGMLYLEHNLGVIYNDRSFDSFTRQTHASRTLTKITAINGEYNIVTREQDDISYKHYLISPSYFTDIVTRFTKTFTKKVGTVEGIGYSWAMYGNKLWADYDEDNTVDRTIASVYANQAMKVASETFGDMITDGGNMYAVKDVSAILNMPISDSLYDAISYKVPFMQMVLHGYKDYAAAPFNIAANGSQNKLASIESGAYVYYSCYTESDELIKRIYDRSIQYPTGITGIYNRIAGDYKEFNEIFAPLRTQLIVEHECLERDLFVTTYEDGTKIVVNYNIYDCEAYGETVPSASYIVLKADGGAN
ncbi:MAG: hypothetical protein IKV36_02395 [Clostridia bacterium]|nr:hypothetical protein [Clostridia bacterium]